MCLPIRRADYRSLGGTAYAELRCKFNISQMSPSLHVFVADLVLRRGIIRCGRNDFLRLATL